MTLPAAQAEAGAFLARLSGAAPIETHISAVYVGSDTAWKMKKAVALGFLDFTRLEDRERFCRRELELNHPHAPGIYRDVIPLTRGPDGALREGGEGPAVEWVLRMAPIPADDFLDRVGRCCRESGALAQQVVRLSRGAVPDAQFMTRRQQVCRHGVAHAAESDEASLHSTPP